MPRAPHRAPPSASLPAPSEPEPPARPRERRQRVQSAATGMAVLKALARLGGQASLTALAAQVDESPAKVHRYGQRSKKAVVQQAGSQLYRLGLEALQIGLAAMRRPIRSARPKPRWYACASARK